MENRDESSASSSSCDIESYSSLPHVAPKRKAGRIKFRETRHPVYRGVRQRKGNKWVCEVREPHKKSRIWVGTFPTPEMAARAHDVAALALRGKLSSLNFPDSAWILPRAKSSSAKHIQIAANEAVQIFRPPSTSSSSASSSVSDLPCLKIEEPSITEYCPGVNSLEDQEVSDPSTTSFLDEEALFDMPGLINGMAEGLLLTPPAMHRGFTWDDDYIDIDITTLWRD